MMQVDVREYQKTLRKMGFRRTHNYRSTVNPDCQTYEREFPEDECRVEVQLWGDGRHRASMWHPNLHVPSEKRSPYGHMTTPPTDFDTVDDMIKAIEYQRRLWLSEEIFRQRREVSARVRGDSTRHLHEQVQLPTVPRWQAASIASGLRHRAAYQRDMQHNEMMAMLLETLADQIAKL